MPLDKTVGATRPVIFVPGVVTPVQLSYAPLLAELGESVRPILKELEVYSSDPPPSNYSIALEVEALRELIDGQGLASADVVAFSGGGAISLSFAARYPDRIRSLAIFEPANVPGALDDYEQAFDQHVRESLAVLPPDQVLEAFTMLHLREGVEPPAPPPGPQPEWMLKRPAGIRAMTRAFIDDTTDRDHLRNCHFPVYLAYGLLTGEYMVHRMQVLAALLPDVWIEAYEGVHHFGPPQRTKPARYAHALRELWRRADDDTQHRPGGDSDYAA